MNMKFGISSLSRMTRKHLFVSLLFSGFLICMTPYGWRYPLQLIQQTLPDKENILYNQYISAHSSPFLMATAKLNFAAEKLISLACSALAPKGDFVAVDCCFVQQQNCISRWLIQRDRGQNVRSPERYKTLTVKSFNNVESYHRRDLSRIPYDHSVLVCKKL